MSHLEHIAVATRAGEMAGLSDNQARGFALLALAEWLISRAEHLQVAAQHADWAEYRRRDEKRADELLREADDIKHQAAQLGFSWSENA